MPAESMTSETHETQNPTPKKPTTKTPETRVRLDASDASAKVDRAHAASQVPQGAREKMPHERDESVGMTGGVPSGKMQQAHRDVTRGMQDTDRGPVADRTYQKQKR
jgi:hypothetical protein